MSQSSVQAKGLRFYLPAALVLLAVSAWGLSSANAKRKHQKKKAEALATQPTHHETIIFAFQPENLFVKLRSEQHFKCKTLKRSQGGIFNQMCNIFKKQLGFYEQKASGKDLRKMFKQLKKHKNVKLMIYTKLEKQFLTQILDDFGISCYFQQKNVVFMQGEHKSAEEIDQQTRRVVIISANKQDRKESILGSNHKLLLNIADNQQIQPSTLNKLQLFLARLAAIQQIDHLHECMHQLALDMDLPLLNDGI